MSKTYKLTYFPITGLGEPIRFILAYTGRKFEDFRLPKDQWMAFKPNTPYGKVPMLEVDGYKLHQARPIVRYLAKSEGLTGADDWESLQIDITVETIDDLRQAFASYFYDEMEASKAAKKGPLLNEIVPFYLEKLDAQVKENGGYFVNSKLSWADIYFAGIADYMSGMAGSPNLYANYPNLQALRDKVFALPKIAEYVAKRPKTDI